jgi:two-component system, NarL family, response regulator
VSEPPAIRILVVDDHPVVREGIAAMISAEAGLEVAGEASTAEAAIKAYFELRPAVMLLDLLLQDSSGIDVIREVCKRSADARIIVLTTLSGDTNIYRSMELGARGYLFKDMVRKELINAIRAVHGGARYIPPKVGTALAENLPRLELTDREVQVLYLVAGGKRNKEIAFDLNLSEATINAHVKHILEKLNASDRTHAVTIALRRGIIKL